jgi:triacylglycerol esterase/lipase EstA (alpha/beta hydrolase family)
MRNDANRRGLIAAACAAAATLVAGVLGAGPASAQASPRVTYSFASGFLSGFNAPTVSPPGANDFSCRPSAVHPYPVVLVHGTIENMNDNWQAASPILANRGYCVFALNYGGSAPAGDFQATGDIAASARQLASFVSDVLAATTSTSSVVRRRSTSSSRWRRPITGPRSTASPPSARRLACSARSTAC